MNKFLVLESASHNDPIEKTKLHQLASMISSLMTERGYQVIVFDYPEHIQNNPEDELFLFESPSISDRESFHFCLSRFYKLHAKIKTLHDGSIPFEKPLCILSLWYVYR